MSLKDAIRTVVLTTLTYFSGNRTHTATALGISTRALRHMLQQYREQGHPIPEAPRRVKKNVEAIQTKS